MNPRIRFKGENASEFPDWNCSQIESILTYERPDRYIVKTKIKSEGKVPVLTANKSFILGYTDEDDGIYKRGDVIIFDDFTCDCKLVNFSFKVKSSAIKLLTTDEKQYSLKFVFEAIKRLNIQPKGHQRHWISFVQKQKLFIPSLEEQQKIASFFSTLDQKIELNERKLEVLEKLKKGLMQKFFKQELRFKSPENRDYPEWEVQKLEKLCSTFKSGSSITQKSIFEAGAYPVYGGNGLRGYTDTYTHDGEYALIGRQGALCGNLKYVNGKTYISEHAIAVQANSENSTQWLYYRLKEMNLNKLSESSAQPGLSAKKLKEILINTPCLEEQIRIANFLACFDEQIKLCTNKLFMLQQLKRSFLRQMFV